MPPLLRCQLFAIDFTTTLHNGCPVMLPCINNACAQYTFDITDTILNCFNAALSSHENPLLEPMLRYACSIGFQRVEQNLAPKVL